MEPTQANPSPETAWIPQGIPTGVFVPNNQVSAQTPVQDTVQTAPEVAQTPVQPASAEQVAPTQSTPAATPAQPTEGPLDRIFKWIARFIAKITGQPDPITGAPNVASAALQKGWNLVGKVWGAANQAVEKASDVAGKAVSTATNVANQAAQKVQEVIPPPTSAVPQTPAEPVAPAQPVPEQPK